MKRHCIELLEKFGSFKYTKSVLKELDSKARAEIDRLGGNPLLIRILDELHNWDIKEASKDKNPLQPALSCQTNKRSTAKPKDE